MLQTIPEFEEIHTEYAILYANYHRQENGILSALIIYKRDHYDGFRTLLARGFENEFRDNDLLRLESLPFRVYF